VTIDLVQRAQRGDHAAFDALATAAYQHLFAVGSKILRDPYMAEDAVQDALFRAWRDLRGLREPARFDAWLHRLLVHACADQGRNARRRRMEVSGIEVERAEPEDDVRRIGDRDELERAFLQLSIEHRAVLVLVHYVGLPATEVATILGLPSGTVYSRLHYATREMRGILGRPSLAPTPEQVR
jgi:RNA polymerase sigma-70 factor (ECF subfamily)